jgi:hypothetical protein
MAKIAQETKREIYIFSFSVLGLLMSLVVYGLGSLIILNRNYPVNLTAYMWILLIGGTAAGFMEGQRWWQIIYVEKAYLKWPKHKLETKLLGLVILIVLTIAIIFLAGNYYAA